MPCLTISLVLLTICCVRRRVDEALVVAALARSRDEALALIDDDRVTVNGAPVFNPARQVADSDHLAVLEVERFVSRGGLKLEAALAHFDALGDPVPVAHQRVLDAGASTGGFVDCLLQRGAAQIVACDVGRGLLHPRIAGDSRVVVRDGVNVRELGAHVAAGEIASEVDLVVADLSFISLTLVVEALVAVVRNGGELLVLVKPQFEARKDEVDRGHGVISDPIVRERCVSVVRAALATAGAHVVGDVASAVPGPAGNREHWLRARKHKAAQ
ncbi:MAG: rRNA (cytidine-2-O)-methyltransferase TlyA [Actinomycetota bacterium]